MKSAVLFAAFAAAPAPEFGAFGPARVPPGCTCSACTCGPNCPCPIVCPPPAPAVKPAAAKAVNRYFVGGAWYVDHPTRPGWIERETPAAPPPASAAAEPFRGPAPGVAGPAPFASGPAGSTPATTARPAEPRSTSIPAAGRAAPTLTLAPGVGQRGIINFPGGAGCLTGG
jgi:hypothetical protein